MTKIKCKNNPAYGRHKRIPDSDIQWLREKNKKYKYHVTLTHTPTGMSIEQAAEKCWNEAEESCMQTLKWRLTHWDEYIASRVRPLND